MNSIRKNADNGQVDLTATGTIYEIVKLFGGESVTIKALSANAGQAYLGFNNSLTTSNGFQLDASETFSLTLPITFGRNCYVQINAVTSNAGDDLCYIKLIDLEPETSAS